MSRIPISGTTYELPKFTSANTYHAYSSANIANVHLSTVNSGNVGTYTRPAAHFASTNATTFIPTHIPKPSALYCEPTTTTYYSQPSIPNINNPNYPTNPSKGTFFQNNATQYPNSSHHITQSGHIPNSVPLFSATVGSNNKPFNINASPFFPPIQTHIDPASHHIIRQSLLKRSDNPYNGESHLFQTFINQINNKTKGINLDAWDKICILEANTSGKPQKLIQSYMNNVSANPQETLIVIEQDLTTKFGSGAKIVSSLIDKVESFLPIKSVHNSDKLEELMEICKLIKTNMSNFRELDIFNYANGIHKIWSKLPEPFQNSWRTVQGDYKVHNYGSHPPFHVFLNFLNRKCMEYSDPIYEKKFIPPSEYAKKNKDPKALKTSTFQKQPTAETPKEEAKTCILHQNSNHELASCKLFASYSVDDKYKLMKEKRTLFWVSRKPSQVEV